MIPLKGWDPGSQIVMRSTWNEKIQAAWPMTVVCDSEEALVLYLAAGTVYKLRNFESDATFRMPVGDWDFIDDEWTADMLRIMLPGDHHAYLAFWNRDHRFSRWYVNLERKYRRTQMGIDFVDHFLDIVIQADLTNWQWKDEHEFAQAVSIGLISQRQAAAIRAEGHRALGRLKANRTPFGEGWERWTRDPQWPIPSLPSNWQSSP